MRRPGIYLTMPTSIRLTSTSLLKTIGMRLRWLREAEGVVLNIDMSQTEWAKRYNFSETQVSNWEHGKYLPRPHDLIAIDLTTGCTLDYLFYGIITERMPAELRATLRRLHPELILGQVWDEPLAERRRQAVTAWLRGTRDLRGSRG